MKQYLRLGFVACVLGLAAIAGMVVGSVRNPSVGARIAHAAGPVDIELHGGGGFEVIALTTECSDNLYPGLICIDAIEIRNAGEQTFVYELEAWIDVNAVDEGLPGSSDDSLAECINVGFEAGVADGLVFDQSVWGPFIGGVLEPGAAAIWGLEISVDDDNACQGSQGFVFAYVTASADEAATGSPVLPDDGGAAAGDDGGEAGGGGGGGGGGAPLPPGSPLDGGGSQFVPPVVGNAGLIGARSANDAAAAWMAVLAVAFATAGIACAWALQVAKSPAGRR